MKYNNIIWITAGYLWLYALICGIPHSLLTSMDRNITSTRAVKYLYDRGGNHPNYEGLCATNADITPSNYTYVKTAVCTLLLPEDISSVASGIPTYMDRTVGQRQQLLKILWSKFLWRAGDYKESCHLLIDVSAKMQVYELAHASFEDNREQGVEVYLGCYDSVKDQPGFVHPKLIAVLHRWLGLQLEKKGDNNGAIAAYKQAISWYGDVWSDPVIRLANLYQQSGNFGDAEALLLSTLKRTQDNLSIYFLARQVGLSWETRGMYSDAYCAYQLALKFGSIVSDATIEQALVGIRNRVNALFIRSNEFSQLDCGAFWRQKGIFYGS